MMPSRGPHCPQLSSVNPLLDSRKVAAQNPAASRGVRSRGLFMVNQCVPANLTHVAVHSQFTSKLNLSILKMLSDENAFEISDIQGDETEASLVGGAECNNAALR